LDNYQDVVHQMERFGIEFKSKDLPLHIDTPKRKTCGVGGKYWYKLYTFRPRAGGTMLLGSFGTYKHGGSSMKVEVDWQPLTDAERERHRAEREAAKAAALAERKANAELAAMDALDLWRQASATGVSPYLQRKGLAGESCRYLPDGTLVIPLIRYDLDRASALQAVQRVLPDGRKFYSKGFEKPGCAVRLGTAGEVSLILICEGYATGLTIRLAVDGQYPVFVAFDAGNLVHVARMLHTLYPTTRLLICADDDWKTVDPITRRPSNPGRTTARKVAKEITGCDLVWPVFNAATRQEKDTDFDDLRQRQGLPAVKGQLQGVIEAMRRRYG
jgi:putative DNA primase/helicase